MTTVASQLIGFDIIFTSSAATFYSDKLSEKVVVCLTRETRLSTGSALLTDTEPTTNGQRRIERNIDLVTSLPARATYEVRAR